jgi:hypothetical protein
MKRIIILDFASASVYASYFPEELEDAQDWFDSDLNTVNLRETNCHYMVVDSTLEVNVIIPNSYISSINIL